MIALLAMFLLASTAEAAPVGDRDLLDALRVSLTSRTLEADAMAQAGNLAQRHGTRLVLRVARGPLKVFQDRTRCEGPSDGCVRHELVTYLAERKFFLVRRKYYEDWDYLLISARNGRVTELNDIPYPAPDWQHFLTIKCDWIFSARCELAVFQLGEDTATAEWRTDLAERAPTPVDLRIRRVQWRDDRIALDFAQPDYNVGNGDMMYWSGSIQRLPAWSLDFGVPQQP